jgi:8-oxo-dGTP pyrophosphatase MutT (NUDIX family)
MLTALYLLYHRSENSLNINDVVNELKNKSKSEKIIPRYAVFAPLIEVNGNTHLLFEIRSNKLSTQPGEISFPGGKIEKNESWREAAIRETKEELNIIDNQLEWISDLDLATVSDSRLVYAGIGVLNVQFEDINPSSDEVYKLFTAPLSFFINTKPDIYYVKKELKPPHDFPYELIPNGKDYNWHGGGYDVPFFIYKEQIIWGLTARIIIDIVSRL